MFFDLQGHRTAYYFSIQLCIKQGSNSEGYTHCKEQTTSFSLCLSNSRAVTLSNVKQTPDGFLIKSMSCHCYLDFIFMHISCLIFNVFSSSFFYAPCWTFYTVAIKLAGILNPKSFLLPLKKNPTQSALAALNPFLQNFPP